MITYGHEPPWRGHTRYGWWEQLDELWDGSGCVWRYHGPGLEFTGSPLQRVMATYVKRYVESALSFLDDRLFVRLSQEV